MDMVRQNIAHHKNITNDNIYSWNKRTQKHYQDRLLKSLDSPCAKVFVAPYGFVHVIIKDDAAWICDIWVDPSHRRQGLATQLLQHAIEWSTRNGKSYIWVNVSVQNPTASNFYEHAGFEKKAIIMEKRATGHGNRSACQDQ